MTRFKGCIDLHQGKVKQIVGGTLNPDSPDNLVTNFTSAFAPSYFANLYRDSGVIGSHVIKLGPGNDEAAKEALMAWPDNLQIGGGIDSSNALHWINDARASHVIVTSYLFTSGQFNMDRLRKMCEIVGKKHLVVDLSCRRRDDEWFVAMNKWTTITDTKLDQNTIEIVQDYCSEILVHAADVEGLCRGIDQDLVKSLGEWCSVPVTYAGGAKNVDDLQLVERLSKGKVDVTFGSSLDIFGGNLVRFNDLVQLNSRLNK